MTVHYKQRILPVTAYGTYPAPDPTEDEKIIDGRIDLIVAAHASTVPASTPSGPG